MVDTVETTSQHASSKLNVSTCIKHATHANKNAGNPKWSVFLFILLDNAVTVDTNRPKKYIDDAIEKIDVKKRPNVVFGNKSPKPTVDTAMMVKYIASVIFQFSTTMINVENENKKKQKARTPLNIFWNSVSKVDIGVHQVHVFLRLAS